MTIPSSQSIMLTLLKYASDGQEHSLRDAIEVLADEFNLSAAERMQVLPSGKKRVFAHRVEKVKGEFKKAGLLVITKRGYFKITLLGIKVLDYSPNKITRKFLKNAEDEISLLAAWKELFDDIKSEFDTRYAPSSQK